MSGTHPSFPGELVLERLREAAKKGLRHCRQGDADLMQWGSDMEEVNGLVADCLDEQLKNSELSDRYPEKNDWIAILRMKVPRQKEWFYVKVALRLPDISSGMLLSFHPWGYKRR